MTQLALSKTVGKAMPLLLAVLAWLLLAAAPAEAAMKAIWGPIQLPDGRSAFPVYRQLGVDVYQIQLDWSRVAPTRPVHPRSPTDPAYRWPATLDHAIAEADANGINVALMVKWTPAWANSGKSPNWAPDHDRDYANFLRAAARRYVHVRHWMIWGETNRAPVWQPLPPRSKRGPRRYARLLDASYVALKRTNRNNRVIGGMTFSFGDVPPADFARWMRLPGGRRPRMDYFGHNPFSRRRPQLALEPYAPGGRDMSDVDTFAREVARAFPRSRPRLWLSEFTVSSDRTNRAFNFFVSRREQARWLTKAFRIADHHDYIGAIGWFGLLDEPASTPRGLTTGLMTYEGRRKPAFKAYRRAG